MNKSEYMTEDLRDKLSKARGMLHQVHEEDYHHHTIYTGYGSEFMVMADKECHEGCGIARVIRETEDA